MNNVFHYTIIGMGKFGTALATVIKNNCNEHMALRTYDLNHHTHTNTFDFSTDLEYACFADNIQAPIYNASSCTTHWIIIAIPAGQVMQMIAKIDSFNLKNVGFLLVSKGVDQTGDFLPNRITQIYENKYTLASLSGPHFAQGLLSQSFTITTIGLLHDNKEKALQLAFSQINPLFISHAALGVQIVSVMKNIASFICGLAKSLDCQENTQATLFTFLLKETEHLLSSFNQDKTLIYNQALLADWILCCHSPTSRNYQAGLNFKASQMHIASTKMITSQDTENVDSIQNTSAAGNVSSSTDFFSSAVENLDMHNTSVAQKSHTSKGSPTELVESLKSINAIYLFLISKEISCPFITFMWNIVHNNLQPTQELLEQSMKDYID